MRPTFSEFSYGFALVNEFIHWTGHSITAVPIYPSLIAEATLGYDVCLERAGIPMFMQFKLAHQMVRRSAKEVQQGVLIPPFYRMHLHPRDESGQHQRLLELEQEGYEVFYAAPEFYRYETFNSAFLQRKMIERSWFFRPSVIGPLPDDLPHHVAFKHGEDHGWFCSKPVPMKPDLKGNAIGGYLKNVLSSKGKRALTKEAIIGLTEAIFTALKREKVPGRTLLNIQKRSGVLDRLAYLSQAFYGAQLFIVQEKPKESEVHV